ncbi:MAG: molybdopterin-dependent oxidoreductase, partial [Clostridiales bacterium]
MVNTLTLAQGTNNPLSKKAKIELAVTDYNYPLASIYKKNLNQWVKVDDNSALLEISQKIFDLQENYGEDSIGIWQREDSFVGELIPSWAFARAIGSRNYFSGKGDAILDREILASLIYGQPLIGDFCRCNCALIWGGVASPTMIRDLEKAVKRGSKLIVIDEEPSVLARRADLFLPVKKGSQGALATALAHLFLLNDWYDYNFIIGHTIGFWEYSSYVNNFSLRSAAEATGLSLEKIIEAAELIYENAPQIAFHIGQELESQWNGMDNIRSILSLISLFGSLDIPGGNILDNDSQWIALSDKNKLDINDFRPSAALENNVFYDYRGQCNSKIAFDEILSGNNQALKALIINEADPIFDNFPDNNIKMAFANLELLVVRDCRLTDSGQMADYLFPSHGLRGNKDKEYDFWFDLAEKMGKKEQFLLYNARI